MTKNDPRPGEEGPRHLVAQAERQLAYFGERLDRAAEDIKAGKHESPRELAATMLSLRKALEAVLYERAKLDKLDQAEGRGSGRGELDLDAARAEIRRRMARLRAAHDPRGVCPGDE